MSSSQLVAKLKALGATPVCIGAQKSTKTGKGGKVVKWTTTPLIITPAHQALATVQKIKEAGIYPLYNIVVMIAGGDAFHGRPVDFFESTKDAMDAIAALRAKESADALAKAQKKLTDEQTQAIKAQAIAEYLASQNKQV